MTERKACCGTGGAADSKELLRRAIAQYDDETTSQNADICMSASAGDGEPPLQKIERVNSQFGDVRTISSLRKVDLDP
jgi:hypothetical protein